MKNNDLQVQHKKNSAVIQVLRKLILFYEERIFLLIMVFLLNELMRKKSKENDDYSHDGCLFDGCHVEE